MNIPNLKHSISILLLGGALTLTSFSQVLATERTHIETLKPDLEELLIAGSQNHMMVLQPGLRHYGTSYNRLTSEWWRWATIRPPQQNPLLDDTGEFCALDQKGKVWFLAGNFGGTVTRHCVVPRGKALFFPILNSGLSWAPEDGLTAKALRAAENVKANAVTSLEVAIDGLQIMDLFAYRAQTPPGGFYLPIKQGSLLNVFGFEAGKRFPAMTDGYWLLLKPLKKGEHQIRIKGEVEADGFELDISYFLTIE